MKIVASLPDPTAISYCSRDGSKIIRRAIAGSARWSFPRIRWTGERADSVPGSDNSTGVLDTPVTLAFVLIIGMRYKRPENINPAIAGEIRITLSFSGRGFNLQHHKDCTHPPLIRVHIGTGLHYLGNIRPAS